MDPPPSRRSGTNWVSSQRRAPLKVVTSNSKRPAVPAATLATSARNAAWCSGTTKSTAAWPTICSGRSASSIARPAGFIWRMMPFGESSFTHSGEPSMMVRSSVSRSPIVASARARAVTSRKLHTRPIARPSKR